MASKEIAAIPKAKPGFDALGISAPVLVQMNPDGKWESCSPDHFDEEQIKAVVQYLVKSQAVDVAQSYCCQCASESQKNGANQSSYVPVIMMPIYPSGQCPFDMECEAQKTNLSNTKPATQTKKKSNGTAEVEEDDKKKLKKRGFVLQRLTDFDLLSQW